MVPVTTSARPEPLPGAGEGDVLELTAGEVVHGGWCVARPDDKGGLVVFVRHALPGERVRVVITQLTAKFARADAVEILAPSADRVAPPCPHARPGGCGGCDWQHASLAAQRQFKASVISQQLRRIAGLDREITVEPLPGDEDGLGWRTRVRFAVRPGGLAGLRQHRSHEIIDIGTCPIAHPLVTPMPLPAAERDRHANHLFVVTTKYRDELQAFLKANGIESLIHYPIPAHLQPPCQGMRRDPQGLSRAESHAATCLSLPCHPGLTDEQVAHVADTLNRFVV